jgi:acetyl-CoA C-acetyltransferase
MDRPIWLAAGVRTPFTRVDGGLAKLDAIGLGVPVLQTMAAGIVSGRIDSAQWGSVSSKAAVPSPPSAQMLTMARAPSFMPVTQLDLK